MSDTKWFFVFLMLGDVVCIQAQLCYSAARVKLSLAVKKG